MSLLLYSNSQSCCSIRDQQHPWIQPLTCSSLRKNPPLPFLPLSPGQHCRRGVVAALKAQQDDSNNPPSTEKLQQQGSATTTARPTLMDGVNWYCYTALGLLFLTDFTPLGQWLLSSTGPTAAGRLALLQWGAFVVPSVSWVQQQGWDLRETFRLAPTSSRQCLIGLAAGPMLWVLINTAIAIKTGNTQLLSGAAAEASSSIGGGSSSSSAMLLMGGPALGLQQAPMLLLSAAVSPAVAEELLFRGLLLTALHERLGRIDAAAVSAALFALIHLDPSQFFLYCVLGGACGAVTVASSSILPAVLLHFGFNAAAVVAGYLLHG